jgi:hypothetical protein
MYANPAQIAATEFASDGEKVAPSSGKISEGYLALELLPAEHLNYYLSMLTKNVIEYGEAFRSVMSELTTILSAASLTPNATLSNQIKAALDLLYKGPFDTHAALTTAHSAVSAATASRMMVRDSAGRAQVADPSADADIATKHSADAAVSAHAALTDTHGAVSAATASRIALRDSAGRAQFAEPSADADAASKNYVDVRKRTPLVNYYYSGNVTEETVFELLKACIPNNDDECAVTGYLSMSGVWYGLIKAKRASSTMIHLYWIYNGTSIVHREVEDGSTDLVSTGIATIIVP